MAGQVDRDLIISRGRSVSPGDANKPYQLLSSEVIIRQVNDVMAVNTGFRGVISCGIKTFEVRDSINPGAILNAEYENISACVSRQCLQRFRSACHCRPHRSGCPCLSPPLRVSLPSPPSRVSLPVPPSSLSLPPPPCSTSMPTMPLSTSLWPRPINMLLLALPVIQSF